MTRSDPREILRSMRISIAKSEPVSWIGDSDDVIEYGAEHTRICRHANWTSLRQVCGGTAATGDTPVFYEEFQKWSNDAGQTVPSDYGKLRKIYGDAWAERIEIEDDLAAYNRGDDY